MEQLRTLCFPFRGLCGNGNVIVGIYLIDRFAQCDLVDRGFDKIIIQPFKPTDDPSVAGFKPVPNIRETIQKKIASYWNEEFEEVEFEAVEFNEDEIFKPKPKADEAD